MEIKNVQKDQMYNQIHKRNHLPIKFINGKYFTPNSRPSPHVYWAEKRREWLAEEDITIYRSEESSSNESSDEDSSNNKLNEMDSSFSSIYTSSSSISNYSQNSNSSSDEDDMYA